MDSTYTGSVGVAATSKSGSDAVHLSLMQASRLHAKKYLGLRR